MILWNKNLGRTRGKFFLLEVALCVVEARYPSLMGAGMLNVAYHVVKWAGTLAVGGLGVVCGSSRLVPEVSAPEMQHCRTCDVASGFAQIEHLKR